MDYVYVQIYVVIWHHYATMIQRYSFVDRSTPNLFILKQVYIYLQQIPFKQIAIVSLE